MMNHWGVIIACTWAVSKLALIICNREFLPVVDAWVLQYGLSSRSSPGGRSLVRTTRTTSFLWSQHVPTMIYTHTGYRQFEMSYSIKLTGCLIYQSSTRIKHHYLAYHEPMTIHPRLSIIKLRVSLLASNDCRLI